MENAGYGRVIRPRPATLILIQDGQTVAQIPIPIQDMDLRTLQSLTAETFQFGVALPATLASGPASVALLIPDPAPSLLSNPAYALPLNSLDQNNNAIFEPGTGYNYIAGGGPTLGPAFELTAEGGFTSNPNAVIDGSYSIEGSYNGTGAYTAFLETIPSVLPLIPNHLYEVTFRYKILTTPSAGFDMLFLSQTGAAAGSFLPSVKITGQAGDTGTSTLSVTLGPYTDYQALWQIQGTGAISVDDIQIVDGVSGDVIATANAESILPSPLSILLRLARRPRSALAIIPNKCPTSAIPCAPWIARTPAPSWFRSTTKARPRASAATRLILSPVDSCAAKWRAIWSASTIPTVCFTPCAARE
jgi:hypothetical protein